MSDLDTAGAEENVDERALIGRVLGERYRVDALIGVGGMGAVYRGHHVSLKRLVAIKVLASQVSERPDMVKRFEREAQAVSMLDHPNCVQLLDYGTTEDGIQYLVMQLLHGAELRDLLVAPIALDRALTFAGQILAALEHAHRRGVVHRDLKPENVFIVQDDEGQEIVKLVDFGVVKLLGDEAETERLTRAGIVFGTPMYMSPEQAAGSKVDGRSDLYAVGILLYEMLTGLPPFIAEDPTMVARMQLISDPPPLPPDVPVPVAEVIMRLLRKPRDERYGSARAAKEALDAAAQALFPAASGGTAIGRESMAVAWQSGERPRTSFYRASIEDSAPPPGRATFEPPGGSAPPPSLPAVDKTSMRSPAPPSRPAPLGGETMLALPDMGASLARGPRRKTPRWIVAACIGGGLVIWGIVWLAVVGA